eukprot:gene630-1221_t
MKTVDLFHSRNFCTWDQSPIKDVYNLLNIAFLHTSRANDWGVAVKQAKGVYFDSMKANHLSNTIIVTASNYGYLNHVHNFKCFMDRLGLKVLMVALDEKTHRYLRKQPNTISYYYNKGKSKHRNIEESHNFRSQAFNEISKHKMDIVYKLLQNNIDVIFIDTDVILVNDPLPILIWNNIDYVHSVNTICPEKTPFNFSSGIEGNTGFYYVRSNKNTIKLWQTYMSTTSDLSLDDQTLFWDTIRNIKDPIIQPLNECSHQNTSNDDNILVTCHPDVCQAGAGAVKTMKQFKDFKSALALKKMQMISIHANWMVGNDKKQSALTENNLWLATQKSDKTWSGTCKRLEIENFDGLIS